MNALIRIILEVRAFIRILFSIQGFLHRQDVSIAAAQSSRTLNAKGKV